MALPSQVTYLEGALEDLDYFHTIFGGVQDNSLTGAKLVANFSINNSTGSGFGGTAQSMAATYKTFVAIAAGSSSVGSGAPSGGAASPIMLGVAKSMTS